MTRVLSALVLLPLVVALIWWAPHLVLEFVLVVVMSICTIELRSMVKDTPMFVGLVVFYIVLPLYVLQLIRYVHGPGALMMLIGIIVVSDTAQYYCGRAFGTRKLAPVISPKKTVEGAIGGAVFGALAGVVFARIWLPPLAPAYAALLSLIVAVFGMAGDLFESALKRRAGMKDSGNLIPGHGGLLDRIDSWLFAAPVFWLLVKILGPRLA